MQYGTTFDCHNRTAASLRVLRLRFTDAIINCHVVKTAYRAQYTQRRTGPLGSRAFARWAGLSAGQVGRHVKCRRRPIWLRPTPLTEKG